MNSLEEKNKGELRLNPRFWDHQWYVLTCLKNAIVNIINSDIKIGSEDIIFDYGCGYSPYEKLFIKYNCRYIKSDITDEADYKIKADENIPVSDGYANGVASFQVLEHVWNVNKYLENCYKILKKDGWLILSTHGVWPYHPHPTDYRRWTKEGLIKEVESSGFKIKKVYPLMGPLSLTTQYFLFGFYNILNKFGVLGSLVLLPITCILNLLILVEDQITPKSITDTNACVYIVVAYK